jgi:type IV pilus assembly protein PilQ
VSNEVNNVPKEVKYITDLESISVKKYQSIIIKTIGRPVYTKKVVDGNLVLEFSEDVKALSKVKNIMSFADLPFMRVRIGNIDSKLSIVIVPNGEIYAKVEKTPEGIMVSGSFDEFSRAEEKLIPVLDNKKAEKVAYEYEKRDLVTLSLKDMDVREAIRLIYYGRNKNIVFGSEVKGTVNLYVKNVPFRKALNVIYTENDLVEIDEDNIVWIITKAKKTALESAKVEEVKAAQQQKEVEPLITEIVPVNYTAASDYKGVIESVLSKRGKLQIEIRTNSFVITDTKESIEKAKDLLASIDIPTPQVTIEARIVEIFDVNDVNIGIQWGGKYSRTFNTSNSFPNTIDVVGGTGGTSPVSGNNYLVNLPVGNPAGALALTLGSISGKYALDVALSALEEENKAKTISSPRITTLDNQEAEIKSGGTALIVPSGDNTQAEEIDVGIKLKVKPHITANNMVYMEIEVEKSSLGQVTANTATTDEKKAKTQVLLASGDTTVIGGIYEDEKRTITSGVPGLSKIPFFGWLFKSRNTITTKRELLVFLTPQVVTQD